MFRYKNDELKNILQDYDNTVMVNEQITIENNRLINELTILKGKIEVTSINQY